jgi:adenylate kinase
MRTIVLLGAPGSGKGTQGKILSRMLGGNHISTGDILRQNVEFRAAIADGSFVADGLICEIVANTLHASPRGCILDGFPRTVPQAEWLDTWYRITPIYLSVPQDALLARILSRGKVDNREDDTEEVFQRRYNLFRQETVPVVQYFRSKGSLIEVEGDMPSPSVTDLIRSVL